MRIKGFNLSPIHWLPLLWALLSGTAGAQSLAIDAHGSPIIPSQAGLGSPFYSWVPTWRDPGDWSLSAGWEGARSLLPVWSQATPGSPADRVYALDGLSGVNWGASVALSHRLSVTTSIPTWFYLDSSVVNGTAGALGDLRFWTPYLLVKPSGGRPGLSVVPWLSLPSGDENRFLGERSTAGGVSFAAGRATDHGSLSVNVGVDYRPWQAHTGLAAGWGVRGSASVAKTLARRGSLGAELLYQSPPGGGLAVPSSLEAVGTFRGQMGRGLAWHAGLARGLTRGVGVASWRVMSGITFLSPRKDSGVPAPRALTVPIALRVTDPEGLPVPNAEVWLEERSLGQTDDAGSFRRIESRPRAPVVVRARGFLDASRTLPDSVDPSGDPPIEVTLAWRKAPILVVLRDETGQLVDGAVVVRSLRQDDLRVATEDGKAVFELPPGEWLFELSAPGRATQLRTVPIRRGRTSPIEMDALLAPMSGNAQVRVSLADIDGGAVEGARVVLDGASVGTASSGGDLTIIGVREGEHKVQVAAEGFLAMTGAVKAALASVPMLEKSSVAEPPVPPPALILRREAGAVRVSVHGPQGRVVDAWARFYGPARLTAQSLGDFGQRVFTLRPGRWQVVITSPTCGVQQREVVVPDDSFDTIEVDVDLLPTENGDAMLDLQVVDVDGRPVADASIALDGQSVGRTSTGGILRLAELAPGPRTLTIRGQDLRDYPDEPIDLVPGPQERTAVVGWKPGTVHIEAIGEEGRVVDGLARFAGPAARAAMPLGNDGEERTRLLPGRWTILVTSPTQGLQQRERFIPAESASLHSEVFQLTAQRAGSARLRLAVRSPDGHPLPDAEVFFDDGLLGRTDSEGKLDVTGLASGSYRVAVRHELCLTDEALEQIDTSDVWRERSLRWAPGVVHLTARSGGAPAADALIRFSGSVSMRAVPVTATGERWMRLAPGRWQALASSPRFGIAQQDLVVVEGENGIQNFDFDLAPLSIGVAEVLVRVQDPDGNPVPDALVQADGKRAGTAGAGGTLLVSDVPISEVLWEAEAPGFQRGRIGPVPIVAGYQERIVRLEFLPVDVDVRVRDAQGTNLDSEIRFDGPEDVTARRTGSDGRASFKLRPGRWKLVASAKDLAMQQRDIELSPGEARPLIEFELLPTRIELTSRQVEIKEQVFFAFNDALVQTASGPMLDEVAATLVGHPEILRVEVQGHTDDMGIAQYNLDLSERRARAVKEALILRGVATERLVARGYGSTQPLGLNADEAARSANRRVQFHIVETAEAR